ncbi:MAG: hypothetical protein H8E15_09355 [Planctomycetes bacterium]|nr:hypothetical protein [Planctomycetota bacterium]
MKRLFISLLLLATFVVYYSGCKRGKDKELTAPIENSPVQTPGLQPKPPGSTVQSSRELERELANWAEVAIEIEKNSPGWLRKYLIAEFSIPAEDISSVNILPFTQDGFFEFTNRILNKIPWITAVQYGYLKIEDVGDLERLILKNYGRSMEPLDKSKLLKED